MLKQQTLFNQPKQSSSSFLMLLILSIVLMLLDKQKEPIVHTVRSALAVIVYPLQLFMNIPGEIKAWSQTNLAEKRYLVDENRQLKEAQLRLHARLLKLAALEQQNKDLRQLLNAVSAYKDKMLLAEVLAVNTPRYQHTMIINKGRQAGVKPGFSVLHNKGVVGQVTKSYAFSAEVLLITDISHAIPVQILRNGLQTIAMGIGKAQLALPFLPQNADIVENDQLITSGLGGQFLYGYPVAKVSSMRYQDGQEFTTTLAYPMVKFHQFRQVLVVLNE